MRDTDLVEADVADIAARRAALAVRAGASRSYAAASSSNASDLAWAVLASLIVALLVIHGIHLHGPLFGTEEGSVRWLEHALKDGGITLAICLVAVLPTALMTGPPLRAIHAHVGLVQAPGSTLHASAGPSAFLATAGSTHAGGDR